MAYIAQGVPNKINLAAAIATEKPSMPPFPDPTCDALAAGGALIELRCTLQERDAQVRNRGVRI